MRASNTQITAEPLMGDGKSVCPLELQAGIIEGYWTENAALIDYQKLF